MRRSYRRVFAVVLGTAAVLVVVGVCVRLGLWQLDRLAQRKERNEVIATRMSSPALDLAASPADTAGLIYRVAELVGEYDVAHGIVLAGRSHQGTPGAHLLLPLRLADGSAMLVHRGWLPTVDASRIDPAAYGEGGTVRVRGLLLALPEVNRGGMAAEGSEPEVAGAGAVGAGAVGASVASAGAASGGAADAGAVGADAVGAGGAETGAAGMAAAGVDGAGTGQFRRVWYRLDGAGIRAQLPYPASTLYLQQLPAEVPGSALPESGYPVALAPPDLDDGPHLGYAIQWFSFGLIALVGWVVLLIRREGRGSVREEGSGAVVERRPVR